MQNAKMQIFSILNKYVIQKVTVFNPYLLKAIRMLQLNFAENYNGKLFSDHFSDIRPHDPEVFVIGGFFKANVAGIDYGTIKICALRAFRFKKLNDIISFLNSGKPAYYQAQLLKQIYTLEPDQPLDYIVFGWDEINAEIFNKQLLEWRTTKLNKYAATTP